MGLWENTAAGELKSRRRFDSARGVTKRTKAGAAVSLCHPHMSFLSAFDLMFNRPNLAGKTEIRPGTATRGRERGAGAAILDRTTFGAIGFEDAHRP